MRKVTCLVGIDEVGRGPLAGPVTVCAFKVPHGFDETLLEGIRDSKKLSAQRREEWFHKVSALKSAGRIDFSLASVAAPEIDAVGISKAIEKAVHECLATLSLDAGTTQVFLDGSLRAPKAFIMQETIIKGDEKVAIISAASIVAKVMRDRHMEEQARLYPGYGFEAHKGYGTSSHLLAIRKAGLSPIHRRSFLKKLLFTAG